MSTDSLVPWLRSEGDFSESNVESLLVFAIEQISNQAGIEVLMPGHAPPSMPAIEEKISELERAIKVPRACTRAINTTGI